MCAWRLGSTGPSRCCCQTCPPAQALIDSLDVVSMLQSARVEAWIHWSITLLLPDVPSCTGRNRIKTSGVVQMIGTLQYSSWAWDLALFESLAEACLFTPKKVCMVETVQYTHWSITLLLPEVPSCTDPHRLIRCCVHAAKCAVGIMGLDPLVHHIAAARGALLHRPQPHHLVLCGCLRLCKTAHGPGM